MQHCNKRKIIKLSGQTLVEVILAVALLAIFASTLSVYLNNQLAYMTRGQSALEAIYLAQEGLEASRSIRDIGWEYLATGTHGLLYDDSSWSFSGTHELIGKFTRTISVGDLSENERQVISLVTWPGTAGVRSIALATNLANWREVVEPLLAGNWNSPRTLGSINLGPGNQPTSLFVRNKIVYMTAQASSADKPDFFVIDATNGMSPQVVGQINTSQALNDLDIKDNLAYVANQDGTNHLQIINISQNNNPYLISSYRLAGNISPALSIAVTGTVAIVGTKNDAGPEIYFVNVANPSTPLVLSTLEVGGDINRIHIKGARAYLATSHDDKEVLVVDISNPTNPSITATLNLPNTNDAMAIYLNHQDNRMYITRKANSAVNSPEINVYNIANPDFPTLLGSKEFANDINAVYAADHLMFIGSTYSSEEFQVFNVTNPANIEYWVGLNFPQMGMDMTFEDNIIYTAVRSNDGLRIITSQ